MIEAYEVFCDILGHDGSKQMPKVIDATEVRPLIRGLPYCLWFMEDSLRKS